MFCGVKDEAHRREFSLHTYIMPKLKTTNYIFMSFLQTNTDVIELVKNGGNLARDNLIIRNRLEG